MPLTVSENWRGPEFGWSGGVVWAGPDRDCVGVRGKVAVCMEVGVG